jgi:hypothetical protein
MVFKRKPKLSPFEASLDEISLVPHMIRAGTRPERLMFG